MFKDILLTVDLGHEGSWHKALPVALDAAKAAAPAGVVRSHALGRLRGSARLATMSRPRGAR